MQAPAKAPELVKAQTDMQPTGPAAAAFLSAAIGVCAYGVIIFIAALVPKFSAALNLWNPAGPLTGKTTLGVLVWLISWAILHFMWRGRNVSVRSAFVAAVALMALGLIVSFPPVFEAFAG